MSLQDDFEFEKNLKLLFQSATNGELDSLKHLVDTVFGTDDINCTDGRFGRTPLYYAAKNGHVSVVSYLVKSGSIIDAVDIDGFTPLLAAAVGKHNEVFNILVANGASMNVVTNGGETLLSVAAIGGNDEVVKLLLEKDVSLINQENSCTRRTALMEACECGHEKVCRVLLDNGAKVTRRAEGDRNKTPLIYAAESGNLAIVNMLLEKDTSFINEGDKYGDTALSSATAAGHEEICRILVKKGADVTSVGFGGRTPLMIAALRGRLGIFKLLLESQAAVNLEYRDKLDQDTILTALCRHKDNGASRALICKLLIERGSNVLASSVCGSALTAAAEIGLDEVVKLLLEKDSSNLEDKNSKGRTALIEACIAGYKNICRVLLEHGANVNAVDGSGRTSLICAASHQNVEVTKALLDTGLAALDYQDPREGKTALMAVCSEFTFQSNEEMRLSICAMLIQKGANVNLVSKTGMTALEYAKELCPNKVVDYLLDQSDLNAVDSCGRTILMREINRGEITFIERLVKKGASVNAVDLEGNSVLIHAAYDRASQIMMLLDLPMLATINHRNHLGINAVMAIYQNYNASYNFKIEVFRVICLKLLCAGAVFYLDPFDKDLGFHRAWQNPANFLSHLDITLELRSKSSLNVKKFQDFLTLDDESAQSWQSVKILGELFPRPLQAICRTTILMHLPLGLKARQNAVGGLHLPASLKNYLNFHELS